MGVISISAVPSTRQIVSGIPQFVTLTVNIPSVIFYTLDGTEPSISSSVYTDAITMPTDSSSVRLRAFATNGVDVSGSLDVTYATHIIDDIRLPQAKVTFLNSYQPSCDSAAGAKVYVQYSQPHYGTLDAYNVEDVFFDGYGPNGEFPVIHYDRPIAMHETLFSDSDDEGQMGHGIGTLPEKADIIYVPPPPEESNTASKTFNPRSMVIFADSRNPTDLVTIFKPYYYDATPQERPGLLFETELDDGGRMISGNFINRTYNSRDNTFTYYYRDSITNRWIISVEPVKSTSGQGDGTANHLFNVKSLKNSEGVGVVFRWILFRPNSIP